MEDIIIFGLGNFYSKNIDKIKEKYNILALWDNNVETNVSNSIYNFKDVDKLPNCSVKILIMVYSLSAVIRIVNQLIAVGIPSGNIIFGLNYFSLSKKDMIRMNLGKFMVCDGNMIYTGLHGEGSIQVKENDELENILFAFTRKQIPLSHELVELSYNPLNHNFAYDRGTPIMRYYIDNFLTLNRESIRGDVMEIGDNRYTVKFGDGRVRNSYILHVEGGEGSIKGDLQSGKGIEEGMIDCFILTQTLDFIYDIQSAAQNIVKALKRGGTALITVAGISQISRYDMDRWGDYWKFTDKSLKRLFSDLVGEKNVDVRIWGNVKSAMLKLYGACAEELSKEDLDYVDEDYQVMLSAVIRKPDIYD